MTRELLQRVLTALELLTKDRIFTADLAGELGGVQGAIRAELAKPEQQERKPAWHDAPTVPGDWVIVGKGFKSELQTGISQQEIERVFSWPGRWYGPIPEDDRP